MRIEKIKEKARKRRQKMRELREGGMTFRKIGQQYGVSRQRVFDLIKKAYMESEI